MRLRVVKWDFKTSHLMQSAYFVGCIFLCYFMFHFFIFDLVTYVC